MSKVHQIPNAVEAQREASAWIARLNADDVSAEDRARFHAWIIRHPLHARAYEELSGTWNELVNAGPWVRAVHFAQYVDDAATREVRRSSAGRSQRLRWALAASVAMAIMGACWMFYRNFQVSHDQYATAVGEHATIALSDGSTLELNSNSVASVDYSKDARVVRLERGEAFFKVAHDKERSFWVVGGGSWVRAVGTAFNVYLRSDDVRVTVSEGTVRVGSAAALDGRSPSESALARTSAAVLTSGEQADLHGSATTTRKLTPNELQQSVTWLQGTVYFDNQPLSQVVEELGRYTSVRIVVVDEKVRNLRVGGTFQTNPQGTQALLNMLEQGLALTVHRESDRVVIESAKKRTSH